MMFEKIYLDKRIRVFSLRKIKHSTYAQIIRGVDYNNFRFVHENLFGKNLFFWKLGYKSPF